VNTATRFIHRAAVGFPQKLAKAIGQLHAPEIIVNPRLTLKGPDGNVLYLNS
jgi:hypothetical protein